jgi:hypothetical protein
LGNRRNRGYTLYSTTSGAPVAVVDEYVLYFVR